MLFNSLATKHVFLQTLSKRKKNLFPLLKSNFFSSSYYYYKRTRGATKFGLLNVSWFQRNFLAFQERGHCSQKVAISSSHRKWQKFSQLPASLVTVENHDKKDYQNNLSKSRQLIAEYEAVRQASLSGGGPRSIERHVKFNQKLLARDRINLVLDEESSFLELSQVAGMGMEYGNVPQAGMLAGNFF